ncbi:Major facilitator sugar transporter-like protein, partial [Dioscorea alata]
IRDLNIAKTEEDIGFYAGFVGAAMMLGRALTSMSWGTFADKYGRKPAIVLSIISLIIFNTLFGLSTNFWMAIATRFLLGCFNGILGTMKAYSSEVCRPQHQALGVSLVSSGWGIGLVIGPAVGGYLAQPAESFPNIFSKDSLFGRFPYFLPCLTISLFAVGVCIVCIWVPETLHQHDEEKMKTDVIEQLEGSSYSLDSKQWQEETKQIHLPCKESLWKNWPLMASIIIFCVFSLYDMAFSEIFPLWAESKRKLGGLGYSSQTVGQVLTISGLGLVVYQLILYPLFERAFGPILLAQIGAVLSIPLMASFPFMTLISGFLLTLVLNCVSLLRNIFCVSIMTGLFIFQNNVVAQNQRGAASGLAIALQSVFRAIAPACAGIILSWAQKNNDNLFLPGEHVIFLCLNVTIFIGFLMTFKPFLPPIDEDHIRDIIHDKKLLRSSIGKVNINAI